MPSEVDALDYAIQDLDPEKWPHESLRAFIRAAQRMRRYSQVCNRKVCIRQDACNAARAYDRAKRRLLDAK